MAPPPLPRTKVTPIYHRHVPKNVLLVLLSLVALPATSTLVVASLIYSTLFPKPKPIALNDGNESKKNILVTGVSMTKGLAIARILAQHTPHRIIGADISLFSPGRFSRALSRYHVLTKPDGHDAEPYVDSLLSVIRQEKVDLWISCSSVVAAVEDGEVVRLAEKMMGKGFQAVQFRENVIERLHEKDHFIDYIRSLDLPVPESHRCTSVEEVLDVLLRKPHENEETTSKFILKPIGVDDKARNNMMTLLPFSSPEKTRHYIKSFSISPSNPFQLQQFITGKEYCTHALVLRGQVVAFTACPSLELLMHYKAIPPSSPLFKQMLAFTHRVAHDGGADFSGHLSFDFLGAGDDADVTLYPIECNPRAHTAVALFQDTPQMASAYLAAFKSASLLADFDLVTPRTPTASYYWLGHDLVTLILLPFLDLAWGLKKPQEVLDAWTACMVHLLYWRDGTFEVWDPLPFWVLYHVHWPVQFLGALAGGRKWSRVNVSTTKVFQA